ncbi:MAG TPA: hypothetical protein VGO47_06760 [Chlamydiales bacterium]|jgi:hypothetical protein|nr:hypothetical protein [Chlamydiales bacterium]
MQELPNKQNKRLNSFEQAYVSGIPDASSLLQKELTVNHTEQILLKKRMQLMQEFMNDLPSYDPQYSMIAVAIEADKIELDELQVRARSILQKIEEI